MHWTGGKLKHTEQQQQKENATEKSLIYDSRENDEDH